MGPCVEGIEAGDTLRVTVLEEYNEESTYRYDIPQFFGPGSETTIDRVTADCNLERDQLIGKTLTFDVVRHVGGEDGKSCSIAKMVAHDFGTVELGEADTGQSYHGGRGGILMGEAEHYGTMVEGCVRIWIAYFNVRNDVDPFEPLAPGEVPPVLLVREISETDSDCNYTEPVNICIFVPQLEKI